jgi:hypothetical protein
MADASRHSSVPSDWGTAFAALPLEAPSVQRWSAIAAQLNRETPRARRRVSWALAAALFALAALPAAWRMFDADNGAAMPTLAAVPDSATRQASDAAAAYADAGADAVVAAVAVDSPTAPLVVDADTRKSVRIASRDSRQTRMSASLPAARRTSDTAVGIANTTAESQKHDSTSLESLYAASAQLETLLSVARDARVESGPAAALASTLDAELATIDAQLAQPGLGALQQQALWQARVETLQASAGFESHLRLLAADGGQLDGMLVSVD